MRSIPVDEKKRGRPPGEKYAAPIPVRLTPEQIIDMDAWRHAQKIPPSRSEAIRRLVEEALKAKRS